MPLVTGIEKQAYVSCFYSRISRIAVLATQALSFEYRIQVPSGNYAACPVCGERDVGAHSLRWEHQLTGHQLYAISSYPLSRLSHRSILESSKWVCHDPTVDPKRRTIGCTRCL